MSEHDYKVSKPALATGQKVDLRADKLHHRYRMVCEMGQAVSSAVNPEVLFDQIMEQTTRILVCEQASVFLYDPDSERLLSRASTDLEAYAVRISLRCGITGWVFRTRSPLIIKDPYDDPRFFPEVDKVNGFQTRNILCTPLVNRSQYCIGTFQALNKKTGEFTDSDLELLQAASHYVTVALENARLHDEYKALEKAKERAINHLSHEIRTPLSVISSVLNHVSDKVAVGDLSKVKNSLLLRGERNLKRLKALQDQIDDILRCRRSDPDECDLDICRVGVNPVEDVIDQKTATCSESVHDISDRQRTLEKTEAFAGEVIELAEFLRGICHRAISLIGDREICLVQEFDKDALLRIDRSVLEKVFTGLLKNAIENTPDEGIVKVAVVTRADEIRITFTDHGTGITSANQKLIFGGFFHTQPTDLYSSKKPYQFNAGGTGADLLRIKSFSKRLGFEVEFSSRRCPFLPRDRDLCPGKISHCRFVKSRAECLFNSGSTFVVRFPRRQPSRSAPLYNTRLPEDCRFSSASQDF
jgi:signal transduction histidine kinase